MAIAQLLGDTALREKMGVAARDWAGKFSWEEMARQSLRFLEKAAGQSK
jgi:glycosyltransferase involved in cell wall biosynthesis